MTRCGVWSIDALPGLRHLLYPRPPSSWGFDFIGGGVGSAGLVIFEPLEYAHAGTFLLSHGNGTDVSQQGPVAQALATGLGMRVVAWEYPGYGPMPGTPCASSICAAAEDAYDWVAQRWPTEKVYVMGVSIGTGPACHLTRVRPVEALVLVAPFTTITDLASLHLHWTLGYVCPKLYDNLGALRKLRAPVLLVHGKRDTLIPWQHSQTLLEAASRSAFRAHAFAMQATHNDWDWAEDALRPVQEFMTRIVTLSAV
jgi:pimeloyl-ACP methyl ester carboxylesterase